MSGLGCRSRELCCSKKRRRGERTGEGRGEGIPARDEETEVEGPAFVLWEDEVLSLIVNYIVVLGGEVVSVGWCSWSQCNWRHLRCCSMIEFPGIIGESSCTSGQEETLGLFGIVRGDSTTIASESESTECPFAPASNDVSRAGTMTAMQNITPVRR